MCAKSIWPAPIAEWRTPAVARVPGRRQSPNHPIGTNHPLPDEDGNRCVSHRLPSTPCCPHAAPDTSPRPLRFVSLCFGLPFFSCVLCDAGTTKIRCSHYCCCCCCCSFSAPCCWRCQSGAATFPRPVGAAQAGATAAWPAATARRIECRRRCCNSRGRRRPEATTAAAGTR